MSKIEFISGMPGPEISRDLSIPLFSDPYHQLIHPSDDVLCFYAIKESKRSIQSWLCCVVEGEKAYAPMRAPYGGYHFNRSISTDTLNRFMGFCEAELSKRGISTLHIKAMPEGPFGNTGTSNYLMWSRGYELSGMELHGFIRATESYAMRLIPDYQRRLRLSREEGFEFRQDRPEKYEEVHDFIMKCRAERGQAFNMDLRSMAAHVEKLGDTFRMYSVFHGKERISAGIIIKVTDEVFYDFTHAHPRAHDKFSPVLTLLEGVNDIALKEGIRYVDVGSNSLAGKPNMPLLAFKKNLGARFYSRSEYTLRLK